jgi:hypothetical protein
MKVGTHEKKEVSQLNNDLFLAAKTIMQREYKNSKRSPRFGWGSVGDYIDWLEMNYDIKLK